MIKITLAETLPLSAVPFLAKIDTENIINGQSLLWEDEKFIAYTPLTSVDLTTALNTKANLVHTHSASDISGLTQSSLESNVRSNNFNAEVNRIYLVDTSSISITVTLPTTNIEGAKITFIDYVGTNSNNPTGFGLNNIVLETISPSTILGSNIYTYNKEAQAITVLYSNNKWFVM